MSDVFDELCELLGKEMVLKLVHDSFHDVQLALDAMKDDALPLDELIILVHKAAGSTAVTGLSDLSQALSEVELMALSGKDPRTTNLDVLISRQLAEDRETHFGS